MRNAKTCNKKKICIELFRVLKTFLFAISCQALVHVSTAYCNCDRRDVAEMIYSPPFNPDDIISLVQWLPEDLLDKVR